MYTVIMIDATTGEFIGFDRVDTKGEASSLKRQYSKNGGWRVKVQVKEGNWTSETVYHLEASTVAEYTNGRVNRKVQVNVMDYRQHGWVEVAGIDNAKNAFSFNLVPAAKLVKTVKLVQR
jgi:hypothetical protein